MPHTPHWPTLFRLRGEWLLHDGGGATQAQGMITNKLEHCESCSCRQEFWCQSTNYLFCAAH